MVIHRKLTTAIGAHGWPSVRRFRSEMQRMDAEKEATIVRLELYAHVTPSNAVYRKCMTCTSNSRKNPSSGELPIKYP